MKNADRWDDNRGPSAEEPFPCPYCGQMLAASCRVCVVCKHEIDPEKIPKPAAEAAPTFEPVTRIVPAKFSWQIFFIVLAASWFSTAVALRYLGIVRGQLFVGLLQMLSSVWVYFDAREKHVAKPFRWGLGSLLLWIVIFPWYLSRRRTPQAPCPFVEAETSTLARVIFLALVLFFLLALIATLLKTPLAK